MKAQAEWVRGIGDKAEEETMCFTEMGYREMGQCLEGNVRLREGGWRD